MTNSLGIPHPKAEIFWRLPLDGDGRSISEGGWTRGDYSPHRQEGHPFARTGDPRDGYNYYDYLLQIARAAELAGFDGLWIPESPEGEAALIVAGSVARETNRLELVIAVRAALQSAVYATKVAVSFQRLTSGRLAWNFVTEADHDPAPWHGRTWSTFEHVARTAEFLDVAKGFWNQAPFTYKGEYYEVVDGGFEPALQGQVLPRVYLSGTSEGALRVSAEKADVHVLPLAPLAQIRRQVAELEALARPFGRKLRYGLEADVLARPTRDEARHELSHQGGSASASSDSLLGTGFGGRRGSALWGLVGSYAEVADALAQYARAGISTFILGAHPHLEEAFLVGEHLAPLLRSSEPTLSQEAV
jgi:alkanesulfonate monooxygenase